jgi:ketosteroid isomerase-like protein
MKLKPYSTFLVLSSLLLTACGGTPTPDLAATAQAAVAATKAAQPTDTATPKPTDTPRPTDTPVPPTATPLPPTDTPILPTETPNPYAEEVLTAFVQAVNGQDEDAAIVLFPEDATIKDVDWVAEGKEDIRKWIEHEFAWGVYYKFSDYEIIGDNVTWTWFTRWEGDGLHRGGKHHCTGEATMSDDKILYLTYGHCEGAKRGAW